MNPQEAPEAYRLQLSLRHTPKFAMSGVCLNNWQSDSRLGRLDLALYELRKKVKDKECLCSFHPQAVHSLQKETNRYFTFPKSLQIDSTSYLRIKIKNITVVVKIITMGSITSSSWHFKYISTILIHTKGLHQVSEKWLSMYAICTVFSKWTIQSSSPQRRYNLGCKRAFFLG